MARIRQSVEEARKEHRKSAELLEEARVEVIIPLGQLREKNHIEHIIAEAMHKSREKDS